MFVNHFHHANDSVVNKAHWTYLQGMYSLMEETSPWMSLQCDEIVYMERHQGNLSAKPTFKISLCFIVI